MFNIFKKKCFVCKGTEDIKTAYNHASIYSSEASGKYHYHLKCVHEVLSEPMKYGNKLVDQAIECVDLIKLEDEKKAHELKCKQEKIDKALKYVDTPEVKLNKLEL